MFVLTQFNSASLNRHVKNAYHFDIFTKGFIDILAAEQTLENPEWFQGTADAVRQCMPSIRSHDFDYLLILSGDQLYQMDFNTILNYHAEKGADITVATIPVKAKEATEFGVMKVNEEGYIVDFIEKPSIEIVDEWKSSLPEEFVNQGKEHLASMGIYVFNKDVIEALFKQFPGSHDFGKEYIPYAVKNEKLVTASYSFGGYWTDIGTISSFFESNLRLAQFLPEINLYDNFNKIYTNPRMLSPSKIFGTRINHALVTEGCIIHADHIENSIVGVRSRIGSGTSIKNTIVMGNDYYQSLKVLEENPSIKLLGIGNNCYIENCIVEKNCKIGDNVIIKGDSSLPDSETELYCIRDGIVILKSKVAIADNTHIGLS
jgi:glucose-1-phosphate adenylyltransferase